MVVHGFHSLLSARSHVLVESCPPYSKAATCYPVRCMDSKASRLIPSSALEVPLVRCRARTALKAVSIWLAVPWSKVAAFEVLLAHQAAAAELDKGTLQPSTAQSAVRWAKIGAAAMGAGTLFAITGVP